MAFCEQCGASLTPGTRFCENCGAAVEMPEENVGERKSESLKSGQLDVFRGPSWMLKWERLAHSAGNELGLILTREQVLLEQVGMGSAEFQDVVGEYVAAAAEDRGVSYAYLDLQDCVFSNGCGDVESVVAALREVVNVARPKYLLILGNEDVIDVARWENRARDGDADVPSDLCYSTLDTHSPWEGQSYDFDSTIRVGRLPSCLGEGFDSYVAYFRATAKGAGGLGALVPYGLSALVWEDESNDEYKAVSSKCVDVSPDVTKDSVVNHIPESANLLFFNLHGSDNTRYWYGQDGGDYPEAFEPNALYGRGCPYVLGVEACYGARYLGGLTPEDSIVLTALRNGCVAFLGSSRIAFGRSEPEGSCADIVIGDYIKHISNGESAGDAHSLGLRRLTSARGEMDDSDVKTLAEFALYGDPSVRMTTKRFVGGVSSMFKKFGGTAKGLSVPMPDVRHAVTMALTEVSQKIEAAIDEYVATHLLPDLLAQGLAAAEQSVFKMSNTGLNQKIYSMSCGPVRKVAKVYFNDSGKVIKAVVSK